MARAARARVQHFVAGADRSQPQEIVSPAADLRGAPRRALFRRGAGTRVGATRAAAPRMPRRTRAPRCPARAAARSTSWTSATRRWRATSARRRASRRATCPILLIGETGTGKELFARALHAASERAGHAFVAVNCAAISEALLQSHIAQAHGGTLFLDEIGELPGPAPGAAAASPGDSGSTCA